MGHRPCFPDNVPVLDGIDGFPGLFIACGHGHFGITSAPASARAMLRMIAGRAPEIALAPYRADRFR
jgi:D-amino-acid dehydrogenase